jgi:hypothetical protein
MKRSGTQLKVHCRNTHKKRGYRHFSRMNENMIQETNRNFLKKETSDHDGESKLGNILCRR